MSGNVIDIEAWLRRPASLDPEDEPEYSLDDECPVYTVREVARLLGRSLGTTYELLRAGEIPAIRLGSRWTIPRSMFDEWLKSSAEKGSGDGVHREDSRWYLPGQLARPLGPTAGQDV
jgi:excisionase family DNA binding protein